MINNTGVGKWWPMAVLAALGAIAGFGYARLAEPTYVTSAYVAAVARGADDNAAAVSYADAYARMARQGEVVSAAVKAGGGGVSAAELRRQVTVTTSSEGPVIEIAGSAGNAARAADLANLVAAGVISTARRHSDQTRVDLVILSPATAPAEPASPRPLVDVVVGAAVGLLLGGLLVLAGGRRGAGGPVRGPVSPAAFGPVSPAASGRVSPAASGRVSPHASGTWPPERRDVQVASPPANVRDYAPSTAAPHRNIHREVPLAGPHETGGAGVE